MALKKDFVIDTEVVVSAPPNHDAQNPTEYHWKKLKDFFDPELVKNTIEANSKFEILQNFIDHQNDIVGYCVKSPNVALVRNMISKKFGKDHPLFIAEIASCRAYRQRVLENMRHAK